MTTFERDVWQDAETARAKKTSREWQDLWLIGHEDDPVRSGRTPADVLRDVEWPLRRGMFDRRPRQRRQSRPELLRLIESCLPRATKSGGAQLIPHEAEG